MADGKCLNCNADSKERPLVKLEVNDKEECVCVKCLPGLIHG
ncbi:MAG: hypothetical protein ACOYJ1_02710 [Peptococcales bacterium]|jgi:hypothetical protein